MCPPAPPPRAVRLLQPLRSMASERVVPSECSILLLLLSGGSHFPYLLLKIFSSFCLCFSARRLESICFAIMRESKSYNSCNDDNITRPVGPSGIIVQPFHHDIIQSQISLRMKSLLHYDLTLMCVCIRETSADLEVWEGFFPLVFSPTFFFSLFLIFLSIFFSILNSQRTKV